MTDTGTSPPSLPYVHRYTTMGGKLRHHFRRKGGTATIKGEPCSPEFMAHYQALLNDPPLNSQHKITDDACKDGVQATPGRTSQVYFVQIGKHVKIGVTRNINARMKTFQTSSAAAQLLLLIPGGDTELERRLHSLLAEDRVVRELFRPDWRVQAFIDVFKYAGLERAIRHLEETTPAARHARHAEERAQRVRVARQSKAELDAYYASLVAERKRRLGW